MSCRPCRSASAADRGRPRLVAGVARRRRSRTRATSSSREKEVRVTINFTMSDEQKKLQYEVRAFAENVLKPVVAAADAQPDPLEGFRMTKPAYIESYKAGIAMCMLPAQYGGGGVSCVDLVIAAEEICVVDPG